MCNLQPSAWRALFFILNSARKLTNRIHASLGPGKRDVSQQELRYLEGKTEIGRDRKRTSLSGKERIQK